MLARISQVSDVFRACKAHIDKVLQILWSFIDAHIILLRHAFDDNWHKRSRGRGGERVDKGWWPARHKEGHVEWYLQGRYHFAILGDLNTMGHGIARFSPNFCCDRMRFRNLWKTEAQFWVDNVLSQVDRSYKVDLDGEAERRRPPHMNTTLRGLGMEESVCQDILNPGALASSTCTFKAPENTEDATLVSLFN